MAAPEKSVSDGSRFSSPEDDTGIVKEGLFTCRQQTMYDDTFTNVSTQWSAFRICVAKVIFTQAWDLLMTLVVIFNIVIVVIETDEQASCYPQHSNMDAECKPRSKLSFFLSSSNFVLLLIYSAESVMRFYVERWTFFKCKFNLLDLFVVLSGWVHLTFNTSVNFSFLRICRVIRLTRALRILRNMHELYDLVNGMMSSMRAMFFGCCSLFLLLLCFAVVCVEYIHPVNSTLTYPDCPECTYGFKSVSYTILTLFKALIGGDAWIISFPLLEKQPFGVLLIVLVAVTINVGLMNLVLTVIVERAREAKESDLREVAREKAHARTQAKNKLWRMRNEVNPDYEAGLTLDQVAYAYEHSRQFRDLLSSLNIDGEDVPAIFELVDENKTGQVCYERFCEEVLHMKDNDQWLLLTTLRNNVLKMHAQLEQSVKLQFEQLANRIDHNSNLTEQVVCTLESVMNAKQEPLDIPSERDPEGCLGTEEAATNPSLTLKQNQAQSPIDNCTIGRWEEMPDQMNGILSLAECLTKEAQVQVGFSDEALQNAYEDLTSQVIANFDSINILEVWLAGEKIRASRHMLERHSWREWTTQLYDTNPDEAPTLVEMHRFREIFDSLGEAIKQMARWKVPGSRLHVIEKQIQIRNGRVQL